MGCFARCASNGSGKRHEPHLFLIARFELIRNLRRRGFLGLTIGLPLLALAILIGSQLFAGSGGDDNEGAVGDSELRAGYVDQSGVLNGWAENDLLQMRAFADEAAARAALEAGEISAYWLIPVDYLASGEITRVQASFSFEGYNNWQIESAIRGSLIAATTTDETNATRFLDPLAGFELLPYEGDSAATVNGEDFGTSFVVVYGFAILFVVSIMMTSGYLLQSVIEEKETKLIEVLLITVRPGTLLTGKALGLGVLGLFQILFWVLTGYGLLQVAGNSGVLVDVQLVLQDISLAYLALLLAYFLLLYFFMAAGFGAVGALSQSMQEGPQFTVVFVLPAMVPLWFTSVFATDPDGSLAVAFSVLPIVSPLAMVQRLAITEVPALEIVLSLALMCAAVLAMFWLAGRLFRFHTLLAGRLPRLREIPQLFRA